MFQVFGFSLTWNCFFKKSSDFRVIVYLYFVLKSEDLMQDVSQVCFAKTCDSGAITPNLVVGWMNSKHKMKISEKTGVAYDPSCVQHQIRITSNNLSKGLVFGVLDVQKNEIIWLEMPFHGQVVQGLDQKGVEALLKKLDSKLSIGNLLAIKAEAQNLSIWESESNEEGTQADEIYDMQWAGNSAAVTKLLVD